jgi:hypothetical protein
MLEFFKKAMEYAPNIESLITPLAAFLTSAPSSSMLCLVQLLLILLHLLPPQSLLLRCHRF